VIRIDWRVALAAILVVTLAAPPAGGPVTTAHAASAFTVTSTADEPDASPGDGRCASSPSGACTLRAAIMEASALGGTSTIDLAVAGTHVLGIAGQDEDGGATGDLDVNGVDLTIRNTSGGGVQIDGTPASDTVVPPVDRVFDVGPVAAAQVRLFSVTVQRGGTSGAGGGIRVGVGSTLSLTDGSVTSSQAGSFNDGGAILNNGAMTLTNVVIDVNVAGRSGGGLANYGTATLVGVTLDQNAVGFGLGGPSLQGGIGGAFYNAQGGGATLTNVTISGNTVRARLNANGGGIANAGTVDLANVTISGNRVSSNLSPPSQSGGAIMVVSGSVTRLRNTIVANSTGASNCSGPATSLGHNLDSDASCVSGPGDLRGDPRLGPLTDNGGPMLTHALLSGSPALDAGDNAACPSVDQRGQPRPRDGDGDGAAICDIGAYEAQTPPLPVCVPRPPVRVAVARDGPGTLVATIAATTPPISSPNRLRALRFGRVANATIDVAGQTGIGSGQSVTLPDGPAQTSMIVHRGPNGDAATVELVVVDDCGDWSTLVGGGRDAWGGPSAVVLDHHEVVQRGLARVRVDLDPRQLGGEGWRLDRDAGRPEPDDRPERRARMRQRLGRVGLGALVEAVYRQEVDRLCAAADELLAAQPPDVALEAWMRRFVTYAATKRGLSSALQSIAASNSMLYAQTRQRLVATLATLLNAAIAAGSVRANMPPEDICQAMSGVWLIPAGDEWAARAQRLLLLLMDGLRFGARSER
jgi:CSLREA domain-containing protein